MSHTVAPRLRVIPLDVVEFIDRKFARTERETAAGVLRGAVLHDGTPPDARLLRCAAVASDGSLDRLRYYVDLLKVDYRDVIMAGEYSTSLQDPERLRDLSEPIREE